MSQGYLIIPRTDQVIKTNYEDIGPERYYSRNPIVRLLYRRRLEIGLEALAHHQVRHVLEVGCGNGFLVPSLQQMAEQVVSIDIHDLLSQVKRRIPGHYVKASVGALPFQPRSFDGIICMSVLEHLTWSKLALQELHRMMHEQSVLIIGIPTDSLLLGLWFRVKRSPALTVHVASHEYLTRIIAQMFAVVNRKDLRLGPASLYTVLKCRLQADKRAGKPIDAAS